MVWRILKRKSCHNPIRSCGDDEEQSKGKDEHDADVLDKGS